MRSVVSERRSPSILEKAYTRGRVQERREQRPLRDHNLQSANTSR